LHSIGGGDGVIDLPPDTHFFTAQMVKDGPDIGVATFFAGPLIDGEFLDRSPRFQALIRNETSGRIIHQGEYTPVEVEGIFLRQIRETTRSNYLYLVTHSAFSTAHAPDNPDASPTEAVDFMKIVPI
jgi:hypothetical protein